MLIKLPERYFEMSEKDRRAATRAGTLLPIPRALEIMRARTEESFKAAWAGSDLETAEKLLAQIVAELRNGRFYEWPNHYFYFMIWR